MKEKKVLKKPTFLFIYGVCIVIILVYILFFAPSSFFLKESVEIPPLQSEETKVFPDVFLQFDRLEKSNYAYDYNILDSMGSKSVIYLCSGKKTKEMDDGSCTRPENFSYDKDSKKEKLSGVNFDLLDLDYIKKWMEGISPKETLYDGVRKLEYETQLKGIKTDISVYTNYENITEIRIASMYETYVMKFKMMDE